MKVRRLAIIRFIPSLEVYNMRNSIWFLVLVTLIAVTGAGESIAQDAGADESRLAGVSRSELVVPGELWDRVILNVGHEDRAFGYTSDEMAHFGVGSEHILRNIEMLFRNITDVPRFTGRMSDGLLSNPQNFAESSFELYRLLDAYSARVMSYELPTGWDVDWIPEGATVDEAFDIVLDRAMDDGITYPIWDDDRAEWDSLPDEVKRLVVRVLIAAEIATPWLLEAYRESFYTDYFGVSDIDRITGEQLYELGTWPWQDESPDPSPRESFEILSEFDINYFATGSNEFMRMVYGAIEEYRSAISETQINFGGFEYCEFYTSMGKIGIFGAGVDTIEGDYSLVVDLGGSDDYNGTTAVPRSMNQPIGVVIDLSGNDDYVTDRIAGLACGNHGIGAIFDLAGDDEYECEESGIASAWFGTGMVVDYGGNDRYESNRWSQGHAYAGVGMLVDLGGDDYYGCIEHSQGHAMTLGCGAIIDVAGNDIYYADPRGNVSELYEGRTCNFAQGAAYGRRADFGDGHSLGGGIGMVVDGGGDDSYTGSCYVQGASYWWALGFIEDRGGDDEYFCEQYSIGSAPHFAIGCAVDLEGDDRYNIGNETIERQYQAHARDGAFGIFIDGSGNDEYYLTNLCAGSSDLNCLSLFWDRMGDDIYYGRRIPPRSEAYSFGDCRTYGPFNTFRDTMASVGVFLDTGGLDVYEEIMPEDEETADGLVRLRFGDDKEWWHREGPYQWGYGLDIDWFEGFVVVEEEE